MVKGKKFPFEKIFFKLKYFMCELKFVLSKHKYYTLKLFPSVPPF